MTDDVEDEVDAPQSRVLSGQLAQAAAWQIGAQLVRRHPALLWLVRTYPFDGFYDCLIVRLLATPAYPPSIMFNLPGSGAAVHPMIGPRVGTDDQVVLRWHEPLLASDPRDFLLELESHAALPPPATLPPSTPSSLAIRWIAAFFAAQLGGRDRWTAHNVWPDELHLDATPFKRSRPRGSGCVSVETTSLCWCGS